MSLAKLLRRRTVRPWYRKAVKKTRPQPNRRLRSFKKQPVQLKAGRSVVLTKTQARKILAGGGAPRGRLAEAPRSARPPRRFLPDPTKFPYPIRRINVPKKIIRNIPSKYTKTYVTPDPNAVYNKRDAICLERAQRREVIHATRKSGKTGQKKPTYDAKSKIIC